MRSIRCIVTMHRRCHFSILAPHPSCTMPGIRRDDTSGGNLLPDAKTFATLESFDLVYVSLRPLVPARYLRIRLAATKWAGPGLDINFAHWLTEYAISGLVKTDKYISEPTSCWYLRIASLSGTAGQSATRRWEWGSAGVVMGLQPVIEKRSKTVSTNCSCDSVVTPVVKLWSIATPKYHSRFP